MEIYILFGIVILVLIALMMVMSNNLSNAQKNTTDMLVNSQKSTTDMQDKRLSELNTQLTERNNALQKSVSDMLVQIESRLKSMQDDNNKKLEEMRTTVDEKLQKTLDSRSNPLPSSSWFVIASISIRPTSTNVSIPDKILSRLSAQLLSHPKSFNHVLKLSSIL